MEHFCGPECVYPLDAAAQDLEEATRLLRASLLSDSHELIWNTYARVRGAKAKLRGAMEDYQEHLLESSLTQIVR